MPTSPTAPTTSISVVLVDDSEDLLFLVRGALERGGQFRVVAEAGDGEQGVAAARAAQPDLVLLDIAMPVMDGMQALPLIREVAPAATVVMLSGYPFSTAGQGALDAGAHGYLEKSDLVHGLIPRLERIIEGSSDGRV